MKLIYINKKIDYFICIIIFNIIININMFTRIIKELDTKIVYDQIAKQFDNTRYKMWPGVKKFLNSIDNNSYILDAGCGNGKNMLETQHTFYGIDTSNELLELVKKKIINKINIIGLEQMSITNMNKINDNTFDAVISIAVIHHLLDYTDRINAIKEFIRVCKKGGSILFTVWKLEDNKVYQNGKYLDTNNDDPSNDTNNLDEHNKIILWTDTKTKKTYDRFYHFFTYDEIIKLIEQTNNELKHIKYVIEIEKNNFAINNKSIIIQEIYEEANNYYVRLNVI
jgi:ubiquinone/menaquinone biosynthesis C-methylase UbiE